jgi:uncharacterized protein
MLNGPLLNNLQDPEVYVIPAGDYFGKDAHDLFLLYSPLADAVRVALPENIEALNDYINGGENHPEIRKEFDALFDYLPAHQQFKRVSSPADYARLSVLLNYKCNFSCSYCYSAKGRSGQEISKLSLKTMLDYFIDANRLDARELTLFISGGGEPLLSWDTLKYGLEYSDSLARIQGFKMKYILITNGSLLNDSIIRSLKKHKVNVCVSFEILEKIQNRQRSQYDRVAANISRMIALGVVPSIISTITVYNVELLEKMVEIVHKQFPEIRNLNFDPAVDPNAFKSFQESKNFHDLFIHHFFEAQKMSRSWNCRLNCSLTGKFGNIRERFCPGKLCLTPESTLSICHSVSSPKEAAFEKHNYGIVRPGKSPEFDPEKFTTLVNTNMHSYPECKTCFARWNCGGGCLMYRNNFTPEMLEGACYYTREFIKRMLLERLGSDYFEKYNNTPGASALNNL